MMEQQHCEQQNRYDTARNASHAYHRLSDHCRSFGLVD